MARKTKAEAAITRKRILKAALDLFILKGYERATFEDVAKRIGLSKGAVYWHFKTKPELLSALVEYMCIAQVEKVSQTLPPPDSLESLKAHFIARAELIVGSPVNRKFFRMMTRLDWPHPEFAPIKRRLKQLETGVFAILGRTLEDLQAQGVVRADADVKRVTAALGAMWLGLVQHEVGKYLETDLSGAIGFGFDALLCAIRA